jgi:hypothetical protein
MSKNAVKHGYYSEDVVLTSESKEDFETLLDALRAEHTPDGISEELIIHDIAVNQWKKMRFEKAFKKAFEDARDYHIKLTSNNLEWVTDGVANMAEMQMKVTKAVWSGTLKAVENRLNGSTTTPVVGEDVLTHLKEMSLITGAFLDPLRDLSAKQKNVGLEGACLTELMQKESKIQAEFERRHEKALKRLYMVRELKQAHARSFSNNAKTHDKASSVHQIEETNASSVGKALDRVAGAAN